MYKSHSAFLIILFIAITFIQEASSKPIRHAKKSSKSYAKLGARDYLPGYSGTYPPGNYPPGNYPPGYPNPYPPQPQPLPPPPPPQPQPQAPASPPPAGLPIKDLLPAITGPVKLPAPPPVAVPAIGLPSAPSLPPLPDLSGLGGPPPAD